MRRRIRQFIEKTDETNDVSRLFSYFRSAVEEFGCDVISYHHLAEGFRTIPPSDGFHIGQIPRDLIDHYLKADLIAIDPIIAEARRRGLPFRWFDLESVSGDLIKSQRSFFSELRSAGILDGYAVPIMIRPGDFAYFGLGSTKGDIGLSSERLLELQVICQQLHLRHIEIAGALKAINLSAREIQALEAIARGDSNRKIADDMGVSPHTIDTIVRRCFTKLGAMSRAEAVLAAVSRGLIVP